MQLTLKQARLLSEKTQKEIASELGVHRDTYMKYEANPAVMPIGKACKFAEITGIPVNDIFFDVNSTLGRTKAREVE